MNLIASSKNTELSQIAQLLDGFEYPAILVSDDYQILAVNKLYQQAFGVLGLSERSPQYCYQVSHGYSEPCDQSGEDCPMQKARNSGDKTRILHIHQTKNGVEHIEIEMLPLKASAGRRGAFVELMKPIPLASGARQKQTMVGSSPAFLHMLDCISKVSHSDASVLLLGETGTGKELAARAIHQSSHRSEKPLITLECSGLTDTLFESELFGHSKGAFTGATSSKKGLVELAHGGTLFLDEIADVPLSMQVKLLRLLENRTFRAIGSTEIKSSDFRLVCATHKNIKKLIAEEKFRADLYHRINVFPIRLPSLQERLEDLPQIARALLQQISMDQEYFVTDSAIQQIAKQPLTGNIRELRNILNRAIVLADTNLLDGKVIAECLEKDQAPEITGTIPMVSENEGAWVDLKTLEKNYLKKMHRAMQGNIHNMADVLGISVRSLYRKLQECRD